MIFDHIRNGAAVVAHPDDEVLWAGGLLARYGKSFTVICCSIPRTDPIRAWKFFDACEVLGVKSARLLPFVEAQPLGDLQHLGCLDLSGFDLIVTHNKEGEYGNPHHRTVHRFIKERWREKMATFGWRPDGQGREVLDLSHDEQTRKLLALKCYDHVSASDGKPKWQALLERYAIDLTRETFDLPVARAAGLSDAGTNGGEAQSGAAAGIA